MRPNDLLADDQRREHDRLGGSPWMTVDCDAALGVPLLDVVDDDAAGAISMNILPTPPIGVRLIREADAHARSRTDS